MKVGDRAGLEVRISAADVRAFSELSGDKNPIHLDEEFAAKTRFKKPIAHGILTASYFSKLLATNIPGPGSIYLSQTLNFKAPVYYDTALKINVEISALEGRRVTLRTWAEDLGGNLVLDGEATVLAPKGD